LSGTATLENGELRGAELPVALSKAKGRLLFTADQAQIDSFTADVGNGRMSMTGGAAFVGLRPQRWRLQIRASDVRVDYPRDARTTLDGDLTLEGNRQLQVLSGLVNVRRAEYLADVDLFEFIERMTAEFGTLPISAPSEGHLLPPTQLDIRVAANDSLVLHTKTLDVVGSAALRLRGPADDPTIAGRITVSRGIIDNLFNERYRVTNGFIEFTGVDKRPPRMNAEAETEISGYRLIVLAAGPLDALRLTPRSEPPLPQADVIALLTSGRLANEGGTASSSQALAQTSVNTIASVFAQPLSRRIETNVTSRLFGLNRFSIDPLLTGRGTDPTARVTVGRRVTKDLSITYSTNLASNQDQIILVEYRVSDRISFVASRAQDGTFGFDVRLRKRF
jgi:translocation and assembly module TamB